MQEPIKLDSRSADFLTTIKTLTRSIASFTGNIRFKGFYGDRYVIPTKMDYDERLYFTYNMGDRFTEDMISVPYLINIGPLTYLDAREYMRDYYHINLDNVLLCAGPMSFQFTDNAYIPTLENYWLIVPTRNLPKYIVI